MNHATQGNLDLFEVDARWFRVFIAAIRAGCIAEVGAVPHSIELIIKAHADFGSGLSKIHEDDLARLAGVSARTVRRAVKQLEESGRIRRDRHGRDNVYQVYEQLPVTFGNEVIAAAFIPSVPEQLQALVQEVRQACASGRLGDTLNVTFVINQNSFTVSGDDNSVTVVNNTNTMASNPAVQAVT